MMSPDRSDDRRLWERAREAGAPPGGSPCPEAMDLAAWADGRAGRALEEAVDAHLARCPACLESLREVRALAREGTAAAPAAVRARAKALVPEPAGTVSPFRILLERLSARTAAGWAAAAVLVATACAAGYRMGQGPASPSPPAVSAYFAPAFGLNGPAADPLLMGGAL
ncbi:MAG: zf-HC2 domain-containing protein [bacterium]|nr:zf-HC2 domain-containing protein [bacterium]